jgi:hypothetical protein
MQAVATQIAKDIRSHKMDLEGILDAVNLAKMRFFMSAPSRREHARDDWFPSALAPPELSCDIDEAKWDDLYVDISCAVDLMASSYLAPALHFNSYLEALALDVEWDEIKYDLAQDASRPSNMLRRLTTDVQAASVLLAVKSALDKLMPIMWFYYPGIQKHLTWGRYGNNGKPKGFMAIVEKYRHTDLLLSDIHAAYFDWIRDAVGPRDVLIHYSNAQSHWKFVSNMTEEHDPIDGTTKQIISGALVQSHAVEESGGKLHSYGPHSLLSYVTNCYQLMDHILLSLAIRLPRKPKIASLDRQCADENL